MNIKKYRYTGCLVLLMMLCGCQHVERVKTEYLAHFEQDYRDSALLAPLKIPEDLSYPMSTENYPLPDCLEEGLLEPVSIEPPGFGQMPA